jgi:hypothetical protein
LLHAIYVTFLDFVDNSDYSNFLKERPDLTTAPQNITVVLDDMNTHGKVYNEFSTWAKGKGFLNDLNFIRAVKAIINQGGSWDSVATIYRTYLAPNASSPIKVPSNLSPEVEWIRKCLEDKGLLARKS